MAGEKKAPDFYDFAEQASSATPAAGHVRVYAKSDGNMYQKDDAGTETSLATGGGGAPTTATYITQTPDGTLSNEQALSALATGLMKVTTTTGVVSSVAAPSGDVVGHTDSQTLTNKTIAFANNTLTGVAKTDLSNLASTAVNTDIISDTDSTDSLGSSAIKWLSAFLDKLVLGEGSAPAGPASGDLALYASTLGKIHSLNDAGVNRTLGVYTEIIAAGKLGSDQTTITLSSIPDHFQDLIVVMENRSNSTNVNSATVVLTLNADTGASYSRNYTFFNNAGTATSTGANNQASMAFLVACTTSSGTSGYFSSLKIEIGAYANSAISRKGRFFSEFFQTATDHQRNFGSFAWENVANAVTSIELNLGAGDFATGTTYALYGVGTKAA